MRVLCLSANLELALLRKAVLAIHGVEVDIARSKKEAESLVKEHNYNAALLCYSISEKSAHNLAGMFWENYPSRCLIYVAQSPWRESPVKADVSVCAIDGPEPLVEAVLSCKPRP